MTPIYTDTPLPLMLTPKFQTGKDDPFTIVASQMALSHNAFIRGFNSIYQQAAGHYRFLQGRIAQSSQGGTPCHRGPGQVQYRRESNRHTEHRRDCW
ncbi:hypothetical protein PG993_013313 [Apiospora rasikravindrae]|uniref:Uncharacterized protein n=1 Tax=Apiospora rasikravindrae TaxID=990691 RepID=A0ABR1RXB5_9PEZI